MCGVGWPSFDSIEDRHPGDVALLRHWAEINSGTYNLDGLAEMEQELQGAFVDALRPDTIESIELPPAPSVDGSGNVVTSPLGKALRFTKRANAKTRVLLVIHYDTVFSIDHPFQRTQMLDGADALNGPGVVDAKGGILVMLSALRALEESGAAENIGWEVILNPDEEIGTPGSAQLLREAVTRNHLGLVYEPALADGSLVGARKGSGTFTIVVRGRPAHAGRDFDKGRSAIFAMAELIRALPPKPRPGLIINCGKIQGGSAVNIVPDLAVASFNVRADTADDRFWFEQLVHGAASQLEQKEGIRVSLHGQFNSPPKPLDARSAKLMEAVLACGRELGLNMEVRPSGGTCDGNKLAAAGLPVVDSLGPVGGDLHSEREYVLLGSLVERAKLTALLLHKLASGEIAPP
jgi:glutamate carboxypeptidase